MTTVEVPDHSAAECECLRRLVSDSYRVPYAAVDVRIFVDPSLRERTLVVTRYAYDRFEPVLGRGCARLSDLAAARSRGERWVRLQVLALQAAREAFGLVPRAPSPDRPPARRSLALDGRI